MANKLELLAPAGSPESVTAAVQSGADAVYLGYGNFNARRNAKNFSREEAAAAISYCHLRGAKVYLTMNTLLTDRELPVAAKVAAEASDLGADAVLVQDLGVLRTLRHVAPDLPLHASTQMSLHSLDGVKMAADLGLDRVVLSRELSRQAIEYICAHSPVEIEVFVHGAMCMCYSGQCFFSSVIGGRSGNRGLCAQPCRLNYGWGDSADSYPLSLKDMCLANYLNDLRDMGVACVKIEGRMKRPEYVAVVTGIYSKLIREGRVPTQEELRQLQSAFSRQGFSDGYYINQTGCAMFGVREKEPEPKDLFAQAKAAYTKENPRVPVTFYAMILPGESAKVGVEDEDGHVATAEGPVPEAARNRPLTKEDVTAQLSKTGGTPFLCKEVKAHVKGGLSLPVSVLNSLRRQVLDDLTAQRSALPQRRKQEFNPGVRYEGNRVAPGITCSFRQASQVTRELLSMGPELIYLPVAEAAAHPEVVEMAKEKGVPVAVTLPRILWDNEKPKLKQDLDTVRSLGVTDALIGTLGLIRPARDAGMNLRADFSMGAYNSQALKELKRLGFCSATASFEARLPQIRDLSKPMDMELIVYGRLPLMITENCIIEGRYGRCGCENNNMLTDRTGARFPVVKAPGCRNEILNSKKLFLADKQEDYHKLGLWAVRLQFTTENAVECTQAAERYFGKGNWTPPDYTRGLYYREVE